MTRPRIIGIGIDKDGYLKDRCSDYIFTAEV
jgi:hypothetical protein